MLGIFKKIGEFGKKIWNGVKNVAKKVVPVVKNILPAITPIVSTLIPGKGGLIMKGLNVGANIADKLVNGTSTPSQEDAIAYRDAMIERAREAREAQRIQVDSPRIRFKS